MFSLRAPPVVPVSWPAQSQISSTIAAGAPAPFDPCWLLFDLCSVVQAANIMPFAFLKHQHISNFLWFGIQADAAAVPQYSHGDTLADSDNAIMDRAFAEVVHMYGDHIKKAKHVTEQKVKHKARQLCCEYVFRNAPSRSVHRPCIILPFKLPEVHLILSVPCYSPLSCLTFCITVPVFCLVCPLYTAIITVPLFYLPWDYKSRSCCHLGPVCPKPVSQQPFAISEPWQLPWLTVKCFSQTGNATSSVSNAGSSVS